MNGINGKTKITGIIGSPVEHTLSPAMQNAAFSKLKINMVYLPFLVLNDGLEGAIAGFRALNAVGFNVTVPHKENVIKYLDEAGPLARKIGAVNTVVSNYGKLIGHNTDASGFIKSLLGKFDVRKKNALVLGAGGAGKAITYALLRAGAGCVYVYDTNMKKAKNICRSACSKTVETRDLEKIVKNVKMVVNATPAGMREGPPPLNPDFLRKDMFVYDIVYNRETELLKEAKKRKIPRLNGIEMLLHQGADAFELWTGKKAPIEVMRAALLSALEK